MKNICFFILLTVLFFPPVVSGGGKTVTLATLSDFPPYCFGFDGKKELAMEVIAPGADSKVLQGYSWDVVRESYHRQGYTIKLYVVPWMRGMYYLRTGKIDAMFPAGKTVEREAIYSFSRESVDNIEMAIYMQNASYRWRGLSDLAGKSVSYVRGWAYGKKWEADQHINKIEADSILQSFEMLMGARVDAAVGYGLPYEYVLRKNGISERIRKVGSFDRVYEYVIALKGNRAGREILDVFDRGKKSLVQGRDLYRIQKKWQAE